MRSLVLDLPDLTVVVLLVVPLPPPPPIRFTFDREALRLIAFVLGGFCAIAESARPVIAAGANAGAARNAAASNGIRNLLDMKSSQSRSLPGPSHHREVCRLNGV